MQSQRQRIRQILKWCLVAAGIVAAVLTMLLVASGFRQTRMVVFGHAQDYPQLEKVTALANYLEFFPRAGKHFYYWCRPYDGDVAGSYEIGEQDFVKWAKGKDWKLQEARGVFETFEVPQPDNRSTWVQLKDGLFYRKQMPKESEFLEPHHGLGYSLDVYFDRTEGKVYFSSVTVD